MADAFVSACVRARQSASDVVGIRANIIGRYKSNHRFDTLPRLPTGAITCVSLSHSTGLRPFRIAYCWLRPIFVVTVKKP